MNEMTTAPLPVFTHLTQSQDAVELRDSANVLISKDGKFIEPTDDASAAAITEFIAQCKAVVKLLESKRQEMKAPILSKTKELEASFKGEDGPMTRLGSVIKAAEGKLRPYLAEKQRLQRAEEQRLRDVAAQEQREREDARQAEEDALAEAAAATNQDERSEAEANVEAARKDLDDLGTRQPVVPAPTTGAKTRGSAGSTAQLRDNWQYELVDIALVPDNFLVDPVDRLNRGKLNKMAKQMKDDATVPGIRFYNEPSITSRTA